MKGLRYAAAAFLVLGSILWWLQGTNSQGQGAPGTGTALSPTASDGATRERNAEVERHVPPALGRTPIAGIKLDEQTTPQYPRLIRVSIRDDENDQVVRYPRCRVLAGLVPNIEMGPPSGSAHNETTGTKDGQLEFGLEERNAWCWIGAEGYSWRPLYLGSEVDLPQVIALRRCGAIDVSLKHGNDDAVFLNMRAQVLDVYGKIVFERPFKSPTRMLHFGNVPPGDYTIAIVGTLESTVEHGTTGVPVLVVRGETTDCSVRLPLTHGNLHRVTGRIDYSAVIPGLNESNRTFLKLVGAYPSAALDGNRGRRFTYRVPITPTADGLGLQFGPMMVPAGLYTLHQGPLAYAWDFAVVGDVFLELHGERPLTTYLECVDSHTGRPIVDASASWSVYPPAVTPRLGALGVHPANSRDRHGVFQFNSMPGRLETRIIGRGYNTVSFSCDVLVEGEHHVVKLEPSPVVVLRAEDSLGNQVAADPDWLSSATLISLAGEIVPPVLITKRETVKYEASTTGRGSSRKRVGMAEVALTVRAPGEYLVVFPKNESHEALAPQRFHCERGVETVVVVVVSDSGPSTE